MNFINRTCRNIYALVKITSGLEHAVTFKNAPATLIKVTSQLKRIELVLSKQLYAVYYTFKGSSFAENKIYCLRSLGAD